MLNRRGSYGAAIFLAASHLAGCADHSFDEATLVLLGANVVTMQDEAVLPDHMVVMAGDRIIAVAPSEPDRLPPGAERVAMDGRYVIPGLVDAHVHVLSDAEDAIDRAFPLLVANGVTSVRDMGSEMAGVTEVRNRMATGEGTVAPHVTAGGPLLDGTLKPWYGNLPLILEDPADVPAALADLESRGVDFFKVYDDLSPEVFRAIAREARGLGLEFAGHVPARVALLEAVDAGQRTVEHFGFSTVRDCVENPSEWFQRSITAKFETGYDAYYRVVESHWDQLDWEACAPVLAALGRAGVAFVPTLDMELNDPSRFDTAAITYMLPASRGWCTTMIGNIDSADEALRERAYASYLDAFRRLRESGATVVAGSDTPNNCVVAGFSLHWELRLLVEAGLTPYSALRAATTDAVAATSRERLAGAIAPGFEADLVVLAGNPLADIEQTRRIEGVVLDGRWLDRGRLDDLLQRAQAAAESGS
ncbi:MAG: amidohydrolase family protein [Gemmatimonadetes bacterium]|nr:amidohydrolase family protein [Gemmatimonadota bacterium]